MNASAKLYLEGLQRFGRDDFEGAVASYRQALELEPEEPEVLHALATVLSKLGRHDEAIEMVQRVTQLCPSDSFAYTSLSIFLQRKGLIPEAEKAGAQARMLAWKDELKKNPNAPPPEGGFKVMQ
jgi:Flp pilus assembly protein TadD